MSNYCVNLMISSLLPNAVMTMYPLAHPSQTERRGQVDSTLPLCLAWSSWQHAPFLFVMIKLTACTLCVWHDQVDSTHPLCLAWSSWQHAPFVFGMIKVTSRTLCVWHISYLNLDPEIGCAGVRPKYLPHKRRGSRSTSNYATTVST